MCSMSSSNKPLRVGITGGIGSGKSTVAQCFESLGVPCFCADRVASDYYNDEDFRMQLHSIFDDGVFDSSGLPDKKAIAAIVFSDKAKLEQLNSLVHPRVMRDFEKWLQKRADVPYVLFESAIIFESNLQRYFDKIICVCAPIDLRMRRIIKRDTTTAVLARQRIDNQISDEWKALNSDYVVRNRYGPKRRQQSVEKIHAKILKNLI